MAGKIFEFNRNVQCRFCYIMSELEIYLLCNVATGHRVSYHYIKYEY